MPRITRWPRAHRAAASAALALLTLAPLGASSDLATPSDSRPAGHFGSVGRLDAQSRGGPSRARRRARPARATSRPAPTAWTSPRGSAELANDLGSMINTRVRGGNFGVMVVSSDANSSGDVAPGSRSESPRNATRAEPLAVAKSSSRVLASNVTSARRAFHEGPP